MPLKNHNDVAAVSTHWWDWGGFGFSRPSAFPSRSWIDGLDVAEQGLERGVQGAVGCQHRTRLQHGLAALQVADVTARFLDQQDPRRDVPDRDLFFPVTFAATGRHIGEVERG